MTDNTENVPYLIGRCSGEGDCLLSATIPIYLKAGLLSGFSKDIFEMVIMGTLQKWAPHCLQDNITEEIIEVYKNSVISSEQYFYSEIFCKWFGDLLLGLG